MGHPSCSDVWVSCRTLLPSAVATQMSQLWTKAILLPSGDQVSRNCPTPRTGGVIPPKTLTGGPENFISDRDTGTVQRSQLPVTPPINSRSLLPSGENSL